MRRRQHIVRISEGSGGGGGGGGNILWGFPRVVVVGVLGVGGKVHCRPGPKGARP